MIILPKFSMTVDEKKNNDNKCRTYTCIQMKLANRRTKIGRARNRVHVGQCS